LVRRTCNRICPQSEILMTGIVEFDFAPTAQEESKGDLLQIDTSIFPKSCSTPSAG
jgi:hypothetical protein